MERNKYKLTGYITTFPLKQKEADYELLFVNLDRPVL